MASHVTDDLSAETIALSRDELRKRMRSNLGRCGAHNGIVAAIAATVSWWRRSSASASHVAVTTGRPGASGQAESLWPTLAAGLCPSKESERGGYGGY
jgi:hypothetical protein